MEHAGSLDTDSKSKWLNTNGCYYLSKQRRRKLNKKKKTEKISIL